MQLEICQNNNLAVTTTFKSEISIFRLRTCSWWRSITAKERSQLRTIYNEFPILGDESESVEVKIGKDLESGIKAVGNIWSFCQGQPNAKQ